MNAEIITIGDEILLGQIVDSNSAWIGQQLNLLNIRVRQITSIADKVQDITQSLSLASSRAELIIVTGGLGPTKDDVTRQTISTYFNKPLVRDAAVLKHVETLFKRFAPDRMMPEINKAQADVLDGCEVLFNDVGTAPGMWIEHQQIKYVFLPGVPFEMKFLTTNRILPKLRDGQREAVAHRHIITIGLGESFLAREITDIEESLPESIKLAFLPKLGLVRLRLTQIGESESSIDYFHTLLVERLGRHVVSTSDISLEQAIVESFTQKGLKLATAESCTGGGIASSITSVPGASCIFDCGIVAYHNTIKQNLLGVDPKVLDQYGAVSEQTVIQMAEGVKKLSHADYAIASSGIAGPGGGTPEKPVGTVWIAVSGKNKTITRLFNFQNSREINIERSIAQALAMLWNLYIEELDN